MQNKTKILELLSDLKENYGVIGVKAEFEDEGASFDEVIKLKEFAYKLDLELAVKIGGCSAKNDMIEAVKTSAKSIIAPMVESPYSAKKFLKLARQIFDSDIKLYINIETKYALNYIEEIIKNNFDGIILGRTDMACSMGFNRDEAENKKILEIAKNLSIITQKAKKEFIIGGGLSINSITFLKELPYLTKFETRKIIFDSKKAFKNNINDGISKAIDFELMWIKYNVNNKRQYEQNERIKELLSRNKRNTIEVKKF